MKDSKHSVEHIVADILSRRGLKQEWLMVASDMRKEIVTLWRRFIDAQIRDEVSRAAQCEAILHQMLTARRSGISAERFAVAFDMVEPSIKRLLKVR